MTSLTYTLLVFSYLSMPVGSLEKGTEVYRNQVGSFSNLEECEDFKQTPKMQEIINKNRKMIEVVAVCKPVILGS